MFNFLALLDIRVFGRLLTIVASDWPCTFFPPKVFLFSIRCFCLAYHFFLLEILRKYYEEVVGEVVKN